MRQIVLVGMLALAACENRPRMYTEAEIEGIATDAASDVTGGRLADLERRIEELERQQDSLARMDRAISSDLDSTQNAISRNARAANENAVRDMTRRGACGYEWVPLQGGGGISRPKACTLEDLSRN